MLYVGALVYKCPIEQLFETFPKVVEKVKAMSAIAVNTVSGTVFTRTSSYPSLTRKGRLARFLVVLSLTVVLGAGFAMKAGAGGSVSGVAPAKASFVNVVVAPGETLWAVASDALALQGGGDVRNMVEEIMSANSLKSPDVQAGQVLRVPA